MSTAASANGNINIITKPKAESTKTTTSKKKPSIGQRIKGAARGAKRGWLEGKSADLLTKLDGYIAKGEEEIREPTEMLDIIDELLIPKYSI